MIKFGKKQQGIIITLAILFLLGRVMDLHAHGHVALSHDHQPDVAISHHHNDLSNKTHLANHLSHSQDLIDEHNDDHGEKTFDIEIPSIVKKQNNNLNLTLLFILPLLLLAWFSPRSLLTIKIPRKAEISFPKKLYLIHQPLRAPPTLV